MSIVETIWENEFASRLSKDKDNGFTYDGAVALFEYLEGYSEEIEQDIEFDAVALRCEYSEMNEQELLQSYGYKIEGKEYKEDIEENGHFQVLERLLEDETALIKVEDGNYIICTNF